MVKKVDPKEFRGTYSRAVRYGFVPSEAELIQAVVSEDKQRFTEALHACTYTCPECHKAHGFGKKDVEMLIRLSMAKSLGRVGFTSVCPNSEVSLSMLLNCRTSDYATPIWDIKKETVKIEVRSLGKLTFESEDFKNLSAAQLNKIVDYHESKEGSYSENAVNKALNELQLRQLEQPKPEIELVMSKRKSLFSKVKGALIKVKGAFR
jgi:hypothetical protein